ncbi:hypothetical protein BH23GEM6_BH23GEM6_01420 [soil metagenome]
MYRCILAPLDGTEAGERALPLASRIAERSGAVLHLVHVQLPLAVPRGVDAGALAALGDEIMTAPEPGYLETLGHLLRGTRGVKVVEAILQGPVAPTLEKYASDCGMSLVVMSMHEHSQPGRLRGSGVAEHVTRSLRIPVLLARPGSQKRVKPDPPGTDLHHFLLPVDGSENCDRMVEHATMLGALFDARYTLIRVIEHSSAGDSAPSTFREAEEYLEVIAGPLRDRGLEVSTRVIFADRPSEGIMAVATDCDVPGLPIDCIAMSSRPQSNLSHLLGSHTVESVIRDTPLTMLLFEPDAQPALETLAVPGLSVGRHG